MDKAKKRFLIIDDDPLKRAGIKDFLDMQGFEVHESPTGKEGFAAAQTLTPDMIVLDLNLPDILGVDLCRMIRNHPKTKGTLILMLTSATVKSSDRVAGFRSGADDYLSQPFDMQEMLERVHSLLRRTERGQVAPELPRAAPPAPAPAAAEYVTFTALPPPQAAKAPEPAKAEARKAPLLSTVAWRFTHGLLAPRLLFSTLDEANDFIPALIILAAIPILETFSQPMGPDAGVASVLITKIFLTALAWFSLANLAYMILPFTGSDATLRKTATAVALSFTPKCLGAAMAFIYHHLGEAKPFLDSRPLSSGIDLIPGLESIEGIGAVIARIGVFDLWSIWIIAIGLLLAFKVPKGKGVPLVITTTLMSLLFATITPY